MVLKSDYEGYSLKLRSLEYDLDEIPKDYFKHETLLIKELFYVIFEEHMTVQEALNHLKRFYNVSFQKIKNKLIREGYIEESLNLDALGEILDSYNAKKLKKILKSNGLKVPKNLEDQKALIISEIPDKIAPKELIATEKAKGYWADNKNRADLFTDCCEGLFYYQEYYETCMNNPEKSDGENLVGFIDMHYDLAIRRSDHPGLINCLQSKGYYYNVRLKDFEKGCDELLKEYVLSINPIYLRKRYFKEYEPISYSLNRNLVAIVDELSTDHVLKRFRELWDEFESDEFLVSYEDAFNYLNQLFEDGNAYEKINEIIEFS
ncbi:hypothetical protein [uncultured Methanobrevibacter sp.]|uniref:hypothetical protein n=1 Tax=uncultured Methanobrevibacter sp. TaxID=253161 RepID=UPI002636C673|nr:hypothetical protein [uncultured Methanobrevibacter sp.]